MTTFRIHTECPLCGAMILCEVRPTTFERSLEGGSEDVRVDVPWGDDLTRHIQKEHEMSMGDLIEYLLRKVARAEGE